MRPSISTPSHHYYWHHHYCLHAFILIAAAALLAGCAGHTPLPMSDVVEMSKQKRTADPIIAKMRSSQTAYALRGSDFGKLREAGVPPAVLDYMQQSFVDDVDLLTRYWVTGESLGGCQRCYPQEVDLSGLATRGAGEAVPLADCVHQQSAAGDAKLVPAHQRAAQRWRSVSRRYP